MTLFRRITFNENLSISRPTKSTNLLLALSICLVQALIDAYFFTTPLKGYKKIKIVGKGAFGTVILCHNLTSEKMVVIKEINMMELSEAEKQMALNEVEVLSSLCHPNIIQYLDSFEVDSFLMIEMEYADGGTLAQLLDRSARLREPEILSLFVQCVAAIDYMHQTNILHRDLKTANVFLTRKNVIKVGDFGISKIVTTKGQAQTVLGTPYYISPEMCKGKQYNTKSDVWALGCILYEMACLRKTFQGENLSALVNNIIKANFEPLPIVYSEGLKKLVSNLLQKNPDIRPSAAEILVHVRLLLIQSEKNIISYKKVRSVLYEVSTDIFTFSCIPKPLPPAKEIVQVAASNTHYIALCKDGMVYTWGDGKRGQLGHAKLITRIHHPSLVLPLISKKVVAVEAGDDFSAFLLDNGVVMTCGEGKFGTLGQKDVKFTPIPKVVKTLVNEKVKQIAVGDHHCAALTQAGAMFTWGKGEWGRLGTGNERNCYEPVRVFFKSTCAIKNIYCGPDCTAVITDVGNVYACGCNRNNKLGIVHPLLPVGNYKMYTKFTQKKILQLKALRSLNNWSIVSMSLAMNHSAALTECGRVVTMGSNADAQLGHKSITPDVVIGVSDKIAKYVKCGSTYTIMTTIQNVVYFWGTQSLAKETNKNYLLSFGRTEIFEWPEELFALYSSPTEMVRGNVIKVKNITSLWDKCLILIDTTVPLDEPETNDNQN